MCGIVGLLKHPPTEHLDNNKNIIIRMMEQISYRGPDDFGVWIEEDSGIVLGHRRLSIIDLSHEGKQPMLSANQRYVISFNGEIYNFKDLRSRIENELNLNTALWRGHSDTEVLLSALSNWGIEKTLALVNGMFAFALWDREKKVLHLARDRIGEKPIYYGKLKNSFVFSSELKALKAHPDWEGEINRGALTLFMRYGYIPSPYSIYTGIYKLTPGKYLTLSLSDFLKDNTLPEPHTYWSPSKIIKTINNDFFSGSEKEAIEELESLLIDSVKIRMESDVPLGAFLSGGIDSTTVVSLMQSISNQPIQTFSIGFYEDEYNEADNAKEVANFLGTDHNELLLTADYALGIIPDLPILYDEPFADPSALPTFLVSKLARKKVTVSLSGDGGDELFGGYNRYRACKDLWAQIGWLPYVGRAGLAKILGSTPSIVLDNFIGWMAPFLNKYGRRGSVANKLHKLSEILAVKKPEDLYLGIISHWKEPQDVVLEANEPPSIFSKNDLQTRSGDLFQFMMTLDALTYLPDDILVKLDRASMRVSLEARVPILDHRVIEFAWKLPLAMKVREGQSKWILRQVLYKYIPKEMTDRPKRGFGVPIGNWLRGPLRDWAENLLDAKRLREEKFFNPEPIRQKWQEHIEEKQNWQGVLWTVLMFQAWLEIQ
jgi:asparagine synthase (glutamine-hydrolysing)